MPKSKRTVLQLKAAYAASNLERASDHLAALAHEFEDVHSDLEEGLDICIALIAQTQTILERFYLESWGKLPRNWKNARERDTDSNEQ